MMWELWVEYVSSNPQVELGVLIPELPDIDRKWPINIRNDRTWYNRCNRANGYMHCVLINYPAAEDRQWDAIVTRISLSLSH